jgi:DNA-binding MarR family transcriptional regulator
MSFTPIPDDVLDFIEAHLTGAEIKVILYLARQRYQLAARQEQPSALQIADGTGYTVSTVKKSLRKLFDRGIVSRQQRETLDDGDLPTLYSLEEPLT